MKYEIVINGARRSVEFTPQTNGTSRVTFTVDGRLVEADAASRISRGVYSILLGGRSLEVTAEETVGWFAGAHRTGANFRWKLPIRAPGGAGAAQESSSRGASS